MTDVTVHAGPGFQWVFAYARNKRADSAVVHLVLVTGGTVGGRTACDGPLVGRLVDEVLPGEHACRPCVEALRDGSTAGREAPPAGALKTWRCHVQAGPGDCAYGLNGYSELVNSLIRDLAPGARFDREAKRWVVPAVYSAELTAALEQAGVEVVTEAAAPAQVARWAREHWTAGQRAELARLLDEP
jgi:hypothetical protein